MSVLQQLQNYSQEEGTSGTPMFDEGTPEQTQLEGMMQASSTPGQSLTQDPSSPQPWETPPEYTDVQEYVDSAFLDISNPETLPTLLNALRNDAPVEYLTEQYLQKDVQKGLISPDLMMLSIEPIMYILITMATYGGIDPNFAEDEDDGEELNAETKDLRMKTNMLNSAPQEAPEMQEPSITPKSLLARSKKAVEEVQNA